MTSAAVSARSVSADERGHRGVVVGQHDHQTCADGGHGLILFDVGSLRVGVDFGTSNSAIAVAEGTRVRVLPLDPIAGETMPSVLYIRRDGNAFVGRAAIDLFLADNRERGPVRRTEHVLSTTVATSVPGRRTSARARPGGRSGSASRDRSPTRSTTGLR